MLDVTESDNVLFEENFRYKYDKTLGLHSVNKGIVRSLSVDC